MAIQSGTHLGPYEILSAIGAGGMGEVYRAHDSKLGRDVAVKVLPETFAGDAQRLARFQREAKLLAALNHSNIASIYGLEDSGGAHALIMELVQGPTLADRIRTGPIPLDEALPIAKQICEALEYAHERGIVHRDLKPANIKVSRDDSVKVLDFGLAKAVQGEADEDLTNSPTLSQMATQQGMLLGTAAYMSPEQAKAKPVDRRADIWAFGCVLYEMLTGQRAFQGETVTETLGAIMRAEPDWKLLPAATPMRVRVLLQRCLQKDAKMRLRDIGDARISLDEVLAGAPEASPGLAAAAPAWRRALPWSVAGVLAVMLAAVAFVYLRPRHTAPPAPLRFEIAPPANATIDPAIRLSPDGRTLAFWVSTPDGKAQVWVHSLDTGESRLLTEGAGPFWSPDNRWIGYADNGKLMKIDATGGPPQTLADLPGGTSFGLGAWNQDDVIVFGNPAGLYRVPASGGIPAQLTATDPKRQEEYHHSPSFLPDGRHVLYTRSVVGGTTSGIYIASIDDKPDQQSLRLLVASNWGAGYAPSADPNVGYLLFIREGTLMAQPFDNRRLELEGQPTPIAEQMADTGGGVGGIAAFSASSTDALVYMSTQHQIMTGGSRGNIQGQLTWFDREGKVLETVGDPGVYRTVAISPDGKRVAFERADSKNVRNLWMYDPSRGVTTRLTFNTNWDSNPVWSPDGTRIAFGSLKTTYFDLYEKASNLTGGDELLLKSSSYKVPSSWSPDGRFLLYYTVDSPAQIWVLPVGGAPAEGKPVLFEDSKFNEVLGRFSPDGRWIAYTSDESGRPEVYVQPFDAASVTGSSSDGAHLTGKWMVSNDGGGSALWESDGKELFYLSPGGEAMAVDVSTKGVFQAGIPKPMFKVPAGVTFWDVSRDGKRFLMAAPSAANPLPPPKFSVVLNWQSALKQ